MTVFAFFHDYIGWLMTILPLPFVLKEYKAFVIKKIEIRKRKKLDRLIDQKKLTADLVESPTLLLPYLAERAFLFAMFFLLTCLLFVVALIGSSGPLGTRNEEIFFRTILCLEIGMMLALMFVWLVDTIELCRAVQNPPKAYERLNQKIKKAGGLLPEEV